LTPSDIFYVRNHLPVPFIDPEEFRLVIETPDGKLHHFSIDDLKKNFKEHTVVATIQCAGTKEKRKKKIALTK
jgi:sulfite oxidase